MPTHGPTAPRPTTGTVSSMALAYTVARDYDDLSRRTAARIIAHINDDPAGLYCFAGGDTPVGTLALVARAARAGVVDLSRAAFVELDEWVGLDPADPGSCVSYLRRNLFEPAGIRQEQIHCFDACATDLEAECARADAFVAAHGGISLTLLGVGVNGHLGFNEPGSALDARAHVVELTESTRTVGTKYFDATAAEGRTAASRGITLGLAQLLAAREVIVQASGPTKRDAIGRVLRGTYDPAWPVTGIWRAAAPQLMVDEAVLA